MQHEAVRPAIHCEPLIAQAGGDAGRAGLGGRPSQSGAQRLLEDRRQRHAAPGCLPFSFQQEAVSQSDGGSHDVYLRDPLTLLLPLQCDGQAQPLRLAAVRVNGLKPRFLSFEGYGFDAYRWGIAALVRIYSQSTCIGCGLLRAGAAHSPGRRCSCRWTVLGPGS